MKKLNSNRRNFLKLSAGIGTGLAFGIPSISAKGQTEKESKDFFQIINTV